MRQKTATILGIIITSLGFIGFTILYFMAEYYNEAEYIKYSFIPLGIAVWGTLLFAVEDIE